MNKYHCIVDKRTTHPRVDHRKLLTASSLDLDAKIDLSPYMSKVFNQGDLGSCTGNAIAAMIEYLENKTSGHENTHFNFVSISRLFIYFNERMEEGTISKDAGAIIADGLKSLSLYGAAKEELWPYDVAKYKIKPPPEVYEEASTRKTHKYAQVEQTEEALMSVLNAGYPIVFGAQIYESFESDEVAKTGVVPLPEKGEKCLGGHCMLISGANVIPKYKKVRNSWDADWGDAGYCHFPNEYLLDPDLVGELWTAYQV